MAEPSTQDMEQLLLDGRLEEIEAGLGGFNLFEAIGHTRREERHSDFLAFLLDPRQPHGLGAEFLTRFAVKVVKTTREASPMALSEIVLADLEGCLVRREYVLPEGGRMDVLCVDETHKFLLAVENKVDSGEGEDQLQRYRAFLEKRYGHFHRVLAYLTPDKDEASDENWGKIGYGEVLSIVEALADKHRESLGDAVVMALDHYARMLRRHIVTDQESELKRLAAAVYRKHKTALDFIFEQRPDDQLAISEAAVALARKDERIKVVRDGKTLINFVPKVWRDIPDFNAAPKGEWTAGTHSLLFEILNRTNAVSMLLVVGPTEDEGARQRIFDFSRSRPELFKGSSKTLSPAYTRIYSQTLIDRTTLERGDVEKIREALESGFRAFMDKEFNEISDAMVEAFPPVRA